MQALFKTLLVLLIAVPLAICAGYLTGEEDYTAVLAIIGGISCLGAYFLLGKGVRPEAFALTVLLCFYYISGKAAAVVTLGGPLFLGEVVLSFTALCFILRFALTREQIAWTNLSIPLMAMLAYSGIHLWFDFRVYGLNAIRDSATAYYMLFFFFGLSISNHPPSAEFLLTWLQRALIFACLVIHPLVLLVSSESRIEVGGRALIAHTSDTVCSSYLAVCVLFYLRARHGGRLRILFYALSIACLASAILQGRSTYTLAILFLMAYLWQVGSKGFAIGTSVAVLLAVLLSTIAVQTGILTQDSGRVGYAAAHMYALVSPVVDPLASREGVNIAQDTIEWRLTWWKYVSDEMWRENPVFGLGFGRDITSGFFDIYSGPTYTSAEEFSVRSPHSVFFTCLGRIGCLGALIFLAICGGFATRLIQTLRHKCDDRDRTFWCFLLVTFVSAFFSVVFEGPNGAIPFWLVLGILTGKMAKREAVELLMRRKLAPGLVKARHARQELYPAFS